MTIPGDGLEIKCSNCQADLLFRGRGGIRIIIFRYCPMCGLDNNEYLESEKWNPWIVPFIMLALVVFPLGGVFFGHKTPTKTVTFLIVSAVMGLIVIVSYIFNGFFFKTCNFCHNPCCRTSDKFCGNCGKPLQ